MVLIRALILGSTFVWLGCGPRLVNPRPQAATAPDVSLGGAHATSADSNERDGSRSAIAHTSGADFPRVPADTVLDIPRPAVEATYHEVIRGESLPSIAPKYGLAADTLRRANGLDRDAVLRAGQLLYVPEAKGHVQLADE